MAHYVLYVPPCSDMFPPRSDSYLLTTSATLIAINLVPTLLGSYFFRQTMETHSNLRSPTALSALPNELLCIIFWFLTRPDLLNLCYIHRFRNVAQDMLYQEFHTDSQNVALFLITILSKQRELYRRLTGARVRYIQLDRLVRDCNSGVVATLPKSKISDNQVKSRQSQLPHDTSICNQDNP
jgi:hypothetical protein